MKISYIDYITAYNRHIRLAKRACGHKVGWERAEAIRDYFKGLYPDTERLFKQMCIYRHSDQQLAIDLLNVVAEALALNESGFSFEGIKGVFQLERELGQYKSMSVNLYTAEACEGLRVITLEGGKKGKAIGHVSFNCESDYINWMNEILVYQHIEMTHAIVLSLYPRYENMLARA